MTLTTSRPRTGRDTLSPAQHAILALLVGHNKSYAYVTDLLGIELDDLRERAHDAVSQLVGWEPRDEFDELLIENALGQLPAGESDAVAVHLRHHAADRSVDARIAAALDGVASRTSEVSPAPLRLTPGSPVRRRSVASAWPSRLVTLLSLGLSSVAAGGVLVLNGVH